MRNWNRLCAGMASYRQAPGFWSYLWGIETTPFSRWSLFPDRVLIVPMRNWNRYVMPTGSATSCSSDRTYEELKPRRTRERSRIYPCSDRTYEELKLTPVNQPTRRGFKVLIVPMRNWNSAIGRSTRKRNALVLIVPMRNWNTLAIAARSSAQAFWSYLWGIETSLYVPVYVYKCLVLIVPMRNWNRVSVVRVDAGSFVLIVPMRNWNL